jgi:hypothetical protein
MRKKFKGRAARALDAWYSTGDVRENLEEARTLLQSPQGFTNIIRDLKARKRGRSEFEEYSKGNSVVQGPRFEREARDAYLRAIDFAFGHNPPVPIRTSWETGAGNTELEVEPTDGVNYVEVTVRIPGVEIDAADEQRLGLTDVRTD